MFNIEKKKKKERSLTYLLNIVPVPSRSYFTKYVKNVPFLSET